jgi:hypothetical protein
MAHNTDPVTAAELTQQRVMLQAVHGELLGSIAGATKGTGKGQSQPEHVTAKGKGKGKGKGPPPPDTTTLAKSKGKGSASASATGHSSGAYASPSSSRPSSSSKKVEAGPPIDVSVMFLDGRIESVQVLASDSVRTLKEKLRDKLEYSAYRQVLIFNGMVLRNAVPLDEMGVVDGSLLNVCIKTPNPLSVDDDVAAVRANALDELTRRVAIRT